MTLHYIEQGGQRRVVGATFLFPPRQGSSLEGMDFHGQPPESPTDRILPEGGWRNHPGGHPARLWFHEENRQRGSVQMDNMAASHKRNYQ